MRRASRASQCGRCAAVFEKCTVVGCSFALVKVRLAGLARLLGFAGKVPLFWPLALLAAVRPNSSSGFESCRGVPRIASYTKFSPELAFSSCVSFKSWCEVCECGSLTKFESSVRRKSLARRWNC